MGLQASSCTAHPGEAAGTNILSPAYPMAEHVGCAEAHRQLGAPGDAATIYAHIQQLQVDALGPVLLRCVVGLKQQLKNKEKTVPG